MVSAATGYAVFVWADGDRWLAVPKLTYEEVVNPSKRARIPTPARAGKGQSSKGKGSGSGPSGGETAGKGKSETDSKGAGSPSAGKGAGSLSAGSPSAGKGESAGETAGKEKSKADSKGGGSPSASPDETAGKGGTGKGRGGRGKGRGKAQGSSPEEESTPRHRMSAKRSPGQAGSSMDHLQDKKAKTAASPEGSNAEVEGAGRAVAVGDENNIEACRSACERSGTWKVRRHMQSFACSHPRTRRRRTTTTTTDDDDDDCAHVVVILVL